MTHSARLIPPLISAKAIPRPSVIPRGRPRGAKRHGLHYEQDFAKAIGAHAVHGQWFEFEDREGKHYCQTDVIVDLGAAIVIFECKYTWVPEAAGKLEGLYRPVVEMAMGKPTIGIVVCKKLVHGLAEPIAAELPTALALARPGRPSVLHWLGVGQLYVGEELGGIGDGRHTIAGGSRGAVKSPTIFQLIRGDHHGEECEASRIQVCPGLDCEERRREQGARRGDAGLVQPTCECQGQEGQSEVEESQREVILPKAMVSRGGLRGPLPSPARVPVRPRVAVTHQQCTPAAGWWSELKGVD